MLALEGKLKCAAHLQVNPPSVEDVRNILVKFDAKWNGALRQAYMKQITVQRVIPEGRCK